MRRFLCSVLMTSLPFLQMANAGEKISDVKLSKPNEFYIVTAHVDGNASTKGNKSHPPERPPTEPLPAGGGIFVTEKGGGKWRMRAFKFIPSQVIVFAGDEITLHFVGTQGPYHRIKIDGVKEPLDVKRGEMKSVTLKPQKAGLINFYSLGRQPSMSGQVVVLDK